MVSPSVPKPVSLYHVPQPLSSNPPHFQQPWNHSVVTTLIGLPSDAQSQVIVTETLGVNEGECVPVKVSEAEEVGVAVPVGVGSAVAVAVGGGGVGSAVAVADGGGGVGVLGTVVDEAEGTCKS
jgi:hypothetical protein